MSDITKLPKWAQHRLQKLEADVSGAKRELAAALGQEPTRIEVDPYRRDLSEGSDHATYLRENVFVRYSVPGGSIDVKLREDGDVEIYGNADAIGDFVIMPRASNVVVARIRPRSR